MRPKISARWYSRAVIIAGSAFFALVVFMSGARAVREADAKYQFFPNQIKSSSAELAAANVLAAESSLELPVRLTIPKINVDASIEYVGLTEDGAMDVPKEPDNAGWFSQGPRPGEKGAAVIAGHYGWKDGKAAVFDDLHLLSAGDKIYVENENGTKVVFTVRESRTYGENDNPTDVYNSNDGKAHLNLITCEGVWNKAEKSYSGRLVVFADKET